MTPHPAADDEKLARLQRLNQLLEVGLALPAGQRGAWFEALSPDDRDLLPSLQDLLARAEVETDGFLQHSPVPALLAQERWAQADDALQPGQPVGPYRLVHELGRGGMATVWLAERDDGARRQVALKLPGLGWSAGLDRRVARERDILAALEHPHIARLYEAGVTPQGRPWLAMEYVRGMPLDAWCAAHQPSVAERLRLFLQVADAVAYAHSRLVVHRDLKPSNILVTDQDDARLLDFGVARLLQDDTEASAQLTRQLGVAVTPEYAAPEQATGQAPTAATDVYALGVVLYEMLAGRRPYTLGNIGLGGLGAAIRVAPVPLASLRCTEPKTARQLRGDLDTILAKALRKEPSRRYVSVEAMAADVRRHLAGEPVLARPASWRYRTGKFIGRNGFALAAGTAVFVSLSVGLVTATWQWHEAEDQRHLALAQMARSDAAADFAGSVLTETVDSGRPVSLEDLMARSERYVASIGDPLARAVSAQTLGAWHVYQGRDGSAEQMLSRTLASLPPGFDPSMRLMLTCQHAFTLHRIGRSADGVARMAATLDQLNLDPDARSYCLLMSAQMANLMNESQTAERHAREAIALLDATRLGHPRRRAELTGEVAYAQSIAGRSEEAEAGYRSAYEQLKLIGRADAQIGVDLLNNWANARSLAGDPRGGLELLLRARELAERRSMGQDPTVALVFNIATAQRVLGRFEDAEAAYRQAQVLAHAQSSTQYEALAIISLASISHRLGRPQEARLRLQQAKDVLGGEFDQVRTPAGEAWRMVQAEVWLQAVQNLPETYAMMTALIEDTDGNTYPGAPVLAFQLRGLASTAMGRLAEGRRDLERALTMAQSQQLSGRPSRATGMAWLALGKYHRQIGEEAAARNAFVQAGEELAKAVGPDSSFTLEAKQLAGGAR